MRGGKVTSVPFNCYGTRSMTSQTALWSVVLRLVDDFEQSLKSSYRSKIDDIMTRKRYEVPR